MGKDEVEHWPEHVRIVLSVIAIAMGGQRLRPEHIEKISDSLGAVIPGHQVKIAHVSGREVGRRKGYYRLEIEGPIYAGGWRFSSGELEKLALASVPLRPES